MTEITSSQLRVPLPLVGRVASQVQWAYIVLRHRRGASRSPLTSLCAHPHDWRSDISSRYHVGTPICQKASVASMRGMTHSSLSYKRISGRQSWVSGMWYSMAIPQCLSVPSATYPSKKEGEKNHLAFLLKGISWVWHRTLSLKSIGRNLDTWPDTAAK